MSKPSKEGRAQGDVQIALDDVLEAYVLSDGGPSRQALAEWVRRYPQYSQELITLTARWSLATYLPEAEGQDEVDEATLIRRGMSIVQNVLYSAQQARAVDVGRAVLHTPAADRSPAANPPAASAPAGTSRSPARQESADAFTEVSARFAAPIRGLLAEGARCGLSPDALANQTGLSISLLSKLERRVILADSIPRVVSERIAGAVGRDLPAVLDYSRLTPGFASGAEHRSSKTPALPRELEDFHDAVRDDPELTSEQRAALLALQDTNA